MMSHDRRDLGIGVDVCKDALANLGVPLHLTTFLKSQSTGLLE